MQQRGVDPARAPLQHNLAQFITATVLCLTYNNFSTNLAQPCAAGLGTKCMRTEVKLNNCWNILIKFESTTFFRSFLCADFKCQMAIQQLVKILQTLILMGLVL